MLVVAGIARAWWDACTRLLALVSSQRQFEGEAGDAHGRFEAGKSVTPHSEVFRPAGLWGCQGNVSLQVNYS